MSRPRKQPPFLPARYAELIANPGPTAPADGLSYGMRLGWALAVAERKAKIEVQHYALIRGAAKAQRRAAVGSHD